MPRSGLSFDPSFEWVLAAQWAGYKLREFRALPGEEQSEIVAAYRCHTQAEAVVAHEQAKEARRKARNG